MSWHQCLPEACIPRSPEIGAPPACFLVLNTDIKTSLCFLSFPLDGSSLQVGTTVTHLWFPLILDFLACNRCLIKAWWVEVNKHQRSPQQTLQPQPYKPDPCIPSRCHQILESPPIQIELTPKMRKDSSPPLFLLQLCSCVWPELPPSAPREVAPASAQWTSWLPLPLPPSPTAPSTGSHKANQLRASPSPGPSSGFLHLGKDSTFG